MSKGKTEGMVSIAGLVTGSLLVGALSAAAPAQALPLLNFNYLGRAAEVRTNLIQINTTQQLLKAAEKTEQVCDCAAGAASDSAKGAESGGGAESAQKEKCQCEPTAAGGSAATTGAQPGTDDKLSDGKCGEGKCG